MADAATLAALTDYDGETGDLRFARATQELLDLRPDDVLVGAPSEAAPHGFLRRVHQVERDGDAVVVRTSQANLVEAIHHADFGATGVFTAADLLEPEVFVQGVTVEALPHDGPHPLATRFEEGDWQSLAPAQIGERYDFRVGLNEVLIDAEVEGFRVRLQVDGEIVFNAGYGIDVSIRGCLEVPPVCLRRFEASVGMEQSARIVVSGDISAKLAVEKRLASIPFTPIVIMVGPVPVVFVPSVDVWVGGSGEVRLAFRYGISERFVARVGARWTSGAGWQDITEFGLTVDDYDTVDVSASMRAEVYARPEGKILLYGLVGPTLSIRVGVEIDAVIPRNPVWRVRPFLTAQLAFVIEVPIIGRLASYHADLFDHRPEGRSAPNAPPEVTVRQGRLRVPLRAEVWLSDNYGVRDREDALVAVTLTSSRAGDDVRHGERSRFTSVGLRTLTVRARDSLGAVTTRTFEVDVYNPPPVVYASVGVSDVRQSSPPPGYLVPLVVGLAAVDPVDGRLPCDAVVLTVSAPDTVTRVDRGGGLCEAEIHFYQQGPRSFQAYATDADGIRSPTRTTTLNVGPPPAFPPPVIHGGVRIDGMERGELFRLTCWPVPYYWTFSVETSDPSGFGLSYGWILYHQRLGGRDGPSQALYHDLGAPPTHVRFPTRYEGSFLFNPIPSWAPPEGVGGPWTVAVWVTNGETTVGRSTTIEWETLPCVR